MSLSFFKRYIVYITFTVDKFDFDHGYQNMVEESFSPTIYIVSQIYDFFNSTIIIGNNNCFI